MRRTLSLLLALLTSQMLFAQTEPQPADDMPFGLIMGIILLSVALACMAAGTIIAVVALSITAAMAAAGFKTLLMLVCTIGGSITGITSLYVANKIFNLDLTKVTIAWAGIAGGLLGGILLSLIIISIIRVVIGFFKERLSL